jgi:hypothetical protein
VVLPHRVFALDADRSSSNGCFLAYWHRQR